MTRTASIGLILALVLFGGACTSKGPPERLAPRSASPTHGSRGAPQAKLSARIELLSTTLRSGSRTRGRLVVVNRTGHAIHGSACISPFQVLLGNDSVRPRPAWPSCLTSFTVPEGRSTFPIQVSARYNTCNGGGTGSVRCVGKFAPGLPPGRYEGRLYQSSHFVPAPGPVTVRVTA